jgi:hypothetical protein
MCAGPQFSMMPPVSNMLDENIEEELESLKTTVMGNLAKIEQTKQPGECD